MTYNVFGGTLNLAQSNPAPAPVGFMFYALPRLSRFCTERLVLK